MPRRKDIHKRTVQPDPKFHDRLITKFINVVMKHGKKSTAEGIIYGAFKIVEEKVKEDSIKVFRRALENVKPQVEVRSRRVGGANFQVPTEVRSERRVALGLRWIRDFACSRNERTMRDSLAGEIMDAAASRGGAFKKKEDTHRMAEANKAFSHFRW